MTFLASGFFFMGYSWKDNTPQLKGLKAGDVLAGNYFEVLEDGSWINKGDSTTWRDIVNSIIGLRLNSAVGSMDYNWAENTITAQPGGNIADDADRIIFNMQYNHENVADGSMHLHMHWEQPNATERTFTIQYRIQKNGEPKTTAWATVNSSSDNSVFPYVSGILNQITPIATVDMTGSGLSATVQFRFTRSDSNAGNIEITFIDAHVPIDSSGSREEYIK